MAAGNAGRGDSSPDLRYAALKARDGRFDGVFFVAVRTTRIYCRPVCRAKLPKAANCSFYDTAAAAERDGYRPCLQCRPELSPGTSRTDAHSRTANAAYRRIAEGALNERSVADLARELYIGERQLRRAVQTEYGVTPVQLAQTQRLLLAKQLLTETNLPVSRIAYASGFSSLTRFNTLFLKRYRMNPTQLRRERRDAGGAGITLLLGYRPPFAWDHLLEFLRVRALPGVEQVGVDSYSRALRAGDHTGWITVRHDPAKSALSVDVSEALLHSLMRVRGAVRSLFDLDAEPVTIAEQLGREPFMAELVARTPGLRLPGSAEPFDIAVRGITGQQVSVAAARTIAARLAERFGIEVDGPGDIRRTSAQPEALAAAAPENIAGLGMPLSRARTIVALARAVVAGDVDLAAGADVERTKSALLALPGIGPWTAEYIAMRALHWPDAFPASDLGIRNALGTKDTAAAAEAWRPWRSYAVIHLWNSLGG